MVRAVGVAIASGKCLDTQKSLVLARLASALIQEGAWPTFGEVDGMVRRFYPTGK
jgi:hypothetical protein